tara:strand:+ start:608 stop:1114 length:507 start_codon:yes stop_codon:yes gene_type:complete
MDKTTTWLVRGASAIVIIFGFGYFIKPPITKLANYISKSKAERAEFNKLSDEDKLNYDFNKAKQRCLNLEEISYSDFIKQLDNNKIKKFFSTPLGTQINTSRGNYLVQENKDGVKPEYTWQYGDDAFSELEKRNINNPQQKYYKKAYEYYLETGQELYSPDYYKGVCR